MKESKIIEICERRFVSAVTLAELLNLHKRTILLWATERGMPFISIGNMRLFDVGDILQWFDENKRRDAA